MVYNEPTYVSDGDVYYDCDWNRDIVDNMIALRLYASSDINNAQQFSTDVVFGSNAHVGFMGETTNAWASDVTINFDKGNNQQLVLEGTTTIEVSASHFGKVGTLRLVQDSDGGHTANFSSNLRWAGSALPTLSTDAWAIDLIAFYHYVADEWLAMATTNFGKV